MSAVPALVDALTSTLIRQAARAAPRALAGRLEEEWLADLAARSPFTRLPFALGCCWAALVIAHEHGATGEPAAAGARTLILELQSRLPRHTGAFLLVLCAHLGALQLLGTYLVFQPQPPDRPVMVSLQPGAAQTPGEEGPAASE
jgi:hypothetical protein